MEEKQLPDVWPYTIRASFLIRNWRDQVWDAHAVFPDLMEPVYFARYIGLENVRHMTVSCGALPPPHQEVVFEWTKHEQGKDLTAALAEFVSSLSLVDERADTKLHGFVTCQNCGLSLRNDFLEFNGFDTTCSSLATGCIRCQPLKSFFKF